ncbi:MAG TPA: histidine--tRNA ligase [Thermohalobaculum sp.]|nr:histidine--tRNA ligase [Thermohalobaculum sp.]
MAKDKQKKTPRPRAETPRGFRDTFGADVMARNEMLARICEVYHHYGFDPLETAAVETVEALGKFLPDVDRPNEGIFAWQDDDEAWLGLRYDLTAPLARVVAQHRLDLPNPYRRYAVGPVWRNEKPGPGRFRQFYQCDADTVGTPTVAADAEICMMLADALEAAGIARGDYVIRVNNRKVLNGVLESIGLTDEGQRAAVLRTIDKFDKVGAAGVRELLGQGRLDASGAYIDGVGLSNDQIVPVIGFLTARTDPPDLVKQSVEAAIEKNEGIEYPAKIVEHWAGVDTSSFDAGMEFHALLLNQLQKIVGQSEVGRDGIRELAEIMNLVAQQGYRPDRIIIDPSVVRGLAYYTGPVYEAELTFKITDDDGNRRQFGSVAGGGRYDDLVKRFTGQSVPATGVSIGVDRLLAALRETGAAGRAQTAGPVVILAMDRDQMAAYQTMCAELRNNGIRAEVFLGGGNMAKQLKYADKRASPIAIIEGGDERAEGIVTLKDLALGTRLAAEIETNEEWKTQPAQITVPRADLVTQVRKMLARAAG